MSDITGVLNLRETIRTNFVRVLCNGMERTHFELFRLLVDSLAHLRETTLFGVFARHLTKFDTDAEYARIRAFCDLVFGSRDAIFGVRPPRLTRSSRRSTRTTARRSSAGRSSRRPAT